MALQIKNVTRRIDVDSVVNNVTYKGALSVNTSNKVYDGVINVTRLDADKVSYRIAEMTITQNNPGYFGGVVDGASNYNETKTLKRVQEFTDGVIDIVVPVLKSIIDEVEAKAAAGTLN